MEKIDQQIEELIMFRINTEAEASIKEMRKKLSRWSEKSYMEFHYHYCKRQVLSDAIGVILGYPGIDFKFNQIYDAAYRRFMDEV